MITAAFIISGLIFLYLGTLLYEEEERLIQSRLVDWWIILHDYSSRLRWPRTKSCSNPSQPPRRAPYLIVINPTPPLPPPWSLQGHRASKSKPNTAPTWLRSL
jgi:hypothetical protein